MSLVLQREAIVTRTQTNWLPAVYGPLFLDNFSGPTAPGGQFTEMTILTGIRRQEGIGGPGQACLRTRSILQFTLYSPQNIGVDDLDKACDFASNLFLKWETLLSDGDKVSFQVPYTLNRGKGSGRYTRVVSCPFYLEEHI
jgi:hypothetical protein